MSWKKYKLIKLRVLVKQSRWVFFHIGSNVPKREIDTSWFSIGHMMVKKSYYHKYINSTYISKNDRLTKNTLKCYHWEIK